MANPLLLVEDLRIVFGPPGREQVAVDGVNLRLTEGEVLGIVGESGCLRGGVPGEFLSAHGFAEDVGEVVLQRDHTSFVLSW